MWEENGSRADLFPPTYLPSLLELGSRSGRNLNLRSLECALPSKGEGGKEAERSLRLSGIPRGILRDELEFHDRSAGGWVGEIFAPLARFLSAIGPKYKANCGCLLLSGGKKSSFVVVFSLYKVCVCVRERETSEMNIIGGASQDQAGPPV